MDNPEDQVDINRNSSETIRAVDSFTISSTSRYGRARKPKCFFQDFYSRKEVVKRGTKSLSPKIQKRTKTATADDFIHVTGDVDASPVLFENPLVETTEDNFDNFMKSVSGQAEDVKPVEISLKELKFFKSTQGSKLQSSTISKVSLKQALKPVESTSDRSQVSNEVIEPEMDVNKVIKIVTKPTEVNQPTDTQKPQKGTVKTYGNKRKTSQKLGFFESFSLPDNPFVRSTTKDDSKITKSTKTSDIDIVINTEDKNQINMDTKTSNANTFFGIKLSPEKPRDMLSVESASVKPLQNRAPPKLITSVTRIGKVQSTIMKLKSVVTTSDTTHEIFATVSKQNIISILPKTTSTVSKGNVSLGQSIKLTDLTKEQQLSTAKPLISTKLVSPDMVTDIPTCKIKSIIPVSDPTNLNNNNQEKKFVKVVMDKTKVLKVLPTAGSLIIKLSETANTSSELDKSDSIASPPYSPIKSKSIPIPKVPIPSVINVSSTSKSNLFTTSTSTPRLSPRAIKSSPKMVDGSTRHVHKEFMSPVSPVKVIGVPSEYRSPSLIKVSSATPSETLSPAKDVNLLSQRSPPPIKSVALSPKLSPSGDIARKRKQELILRKESDHSYSISPPSRALLPIPPKKKFMARMKTAAVSQKVITPIEKEAQPTFLERNIEETKKDDKDSIKEDIFSERLLRVDSKVDKEEKTPLSGLQHEVVVPDIVQGNENVKESVRVTSEPQKSEQSIEAASPKACVIDINNSSVARLTKFSLTEGSYLNKLIENTEQVVNKPLEAVAKNVVRVSPRKGKGMNAFLWEMNSGAFFIKQTIKGKLPDVKIEEVQKKLLNDNIIKTVELFGSEKNDLLKEENMKETKAPHSPSIKEKHDEEVEDTVITKDIPEKINTFPITKKKRRLFKVQKIINKPKHVGKIVKTIPKQMKAIVIKPKKVPVQPNAKDIQIGRQLRARKFIFAEQISSANRKTVPEALDKTAKSPSREVGKEKSLGVNEMLGEKQTYTEEIEIMQSMEIKQEVDNGEVIETMESKFENKTAITAEKHITEKIQMLTANTNIKKSAKRAKNKAVTPTGRLLPVIIRADTPEKTVEINSDINIKTKRSLRIKNSKQTEIEPLNEDVILIPIQKKIIEINSDDEGGGDILKKPRLIRNQHSEQKSASDDFVMKTEIKKESVTPDKKNVATGVNVLKRKRRARRSTKHMRKLKWLNSDLHEAKESNLQKPVVIPMPINAHHDADKEMNAEIKEEKVDCEYMEDSHLHKSMSTDKKLQTPEGLVSAKYSEGDMVWAKVGCHPYWPAMITRDPTANWIQQIISSKLNNKVPYYHVRYFADNGRRSWVRATALMSYKHKNDLDIIVNSIPSGYSKKYDVPKSKFPLWKIAIEELESIKDSDLFVKLDFFMQAVLRSAKKKKNLSPRLKGIKREKPDDYCEDSSPNIAYKTLSSTRKLPIPIPEVKTPTSSRARRLSSTDILNKDSPRSHIDRFLQNQLEDKITWKRSHSRSIDDEQSQSKLDSDIQRLKDYDTTDCSSSETDSIHHKIPSSGPIPVSIEYQELLLKRNNLFRKVSRDKVCEICFKPNNILACRGPCSGLYHLDCANGYLDDSSNQIAESISIQLSTKSYKKTSLSRLRKNRSFKAESTSSNSSDVDSSKVSFKDKKNSKIYNTFICGSCDRNDHCVCFVCNKEITPLGDHVITKCNVAKCGKAYHRGCTRLWPQVQWWDKPTNTSDPTTHVVTSVVCPRHVCHICVSDDPKAASARACRTEALVHCLLCPATYHSATACIPAGTEIYTYSQVVCPRHLTLPAQAYSLSSVVSQFDNTNQVASVQDYYTKPLPTINTTWCLICSIGGSLVCCERCPTSVHEACSPINWMDDGNYICEDCETGRLILYDEVVWVKLGKYRWWPALVLYPKDVPLNVWNMRHRRGEFVIKFFGSYDHHWMGQGRVFLYQDGDKAPTYSVRNAKSLDVTFVKAVEEAAEAYKVKREFKSVLQSGSRQPKSLKPPAYIKIRFNKPVGNVKIYDGNVSITTPCFCDPVADSPCGPNANCINRLLWTECNPRNCPAGQRCQNQLFATRQYPPLVPYKTDGRGWGLKTLVPLATGQFVIEYVGEVIEEQEYKRRVEHMQNQAQQNYYFLTIDSDRIIDAGPKGNVARFMNHSCAPNCETQKWTVNGDTRVGIFASENIPANKELTFNYNLAPNGKALLECKCKAVGCSGFIGVKKTAENPKAKVLVEKLLLKKKKRIAKSTRIKNKILFDRTCFICGKVGKLITCSNLSCSETYHIECVKLMNIPYAFWKCPRHYCNVCSRKIVKRCKFCINSYCLQHCNVKAEGKIMEFICPDHHNNASTKIKEEVDVKKDIIRNEIPKEINASKNGKSASILVIPKQEQLDMNETIVASNKIGKAKLLRNIKKISPKKNIGIKKQRNQIKCKVLTKRQLRRSR